MKVLLDTNVLCRLAAKDHPLHFVAETAVSLLGDKAHEFYLVPQVLYEYWVVATRPVANNGLGVPPRDANTAIDLWCELFTLFRDERGIFSIWRDLVRQYDIKGKSAHDARLVAAMKRHGLTHLMTFNLSDFQRYEGIKLIDPQAVAAT